MLLYIMFQMHCSIEYCSDRQRYMAKDHASQAGTFVNSKRLSEVSLCIALVLRKKVIN